MTTQDFIEKNSRNRVRVRTPQRERFKDVRPRLATGGHHRRQVLRDQGTTAEQLGELAAQHQLVLHELSPQRASLEEAFMQLTADSVEYHAQMGDEPALDPAAMVGGTK